ncbi:TcpD family membrane protein [Ectobacillus panaciterrae]|uniref:TcpD family membrane protein n=1 Tax=Ectobacillus panaciterrae TaxID=363872 RepID=UPI00042992A7|nr:TcpD family membrane protein [Ectobacillus panaciterrae]
MIPNLHNLATQILGAVLSVFTIMLAVRAVRDWNRGAVGQFIGAIVFGIVAYVLIAQPEEFGNFAKGIWSSLKSGGLN